MHLMLAEVQSFGHFQHACVIIDCGNLQAVENRELKKQLNASNRQVAEQKDEVAKWKALYEKEERRLRKFMNSEPK